MSYPRLLVQRLWSAWDIIKEYRRGNLEDVESQIVLHKNLSELIRTRVSHNLPKLKILEIGCGQRGAQTLLFTADGADVIGVDIEVPNITMDVQTFLRILRVNNLERALKSFGRHLLFDSQFFRQLSRRYGKALPLNKVDVRQMDATRMDFPGNYFDFIYSTLVFEHITRVGAAVQEVNRILKPEGIAWINIHLFPSLSGGHHKEWTNPRTLRSPQVPPWDHLMGKKYPIDNTLNKLTLNDYNQIFSDHIDVVGQSFVTEGLEVLTPTLEEILIKKGYSRIDLCTREVAFLCRKR
jgi:SAM-dependent methyltransferase